MADTLKISTSGSTREGKIDVDGMIWDVTLPGSATEMRISRASRSCKLLASRINLLDKKIEKDTITESELDKYEEYCMKFDASEQIMQTVFSSMFRDSTPDNAEVKKWIDETPSFALIQAFEDLKTQADEGEAIDDSTGTPSTS